jgi:O-antigen ligase
MVAALLFALRSPFYAFIVFVITLPFENALVLTSVFTVTPSYVALLFIIAVFWVHSLYRIPYGSFRSPLNPYICLYIAVSVLSIIMTVILPPPRIELTGEIGWRGVEFRSIIQVIFLIFSSLGYFFTIYVCSDKARVKKILLVYIITASMVSLYGIYQLFAVFYRLPFVASLVMSYYEMPTSYRVHGTFREPLNFGHYLLSVLPFLLTVYVHRKQIRAPDRLAHGITLMPMLVIMGGALLSTVSRGAWVGFVGALLVILVGSRGENRRKILGVVMFIALCIVPLTVYFYGGLVSFLVSQRVFERFSGKYVLEDPRLWAFPFMLDLFQQYPILGVGYGNYTLHHAAYYGLERLSGAMSLYAQAALETGIVGFLALVGMIAAYYKILICALRKAKGTEWWPYILGYLASFTGLMIQYVFFGDRLNLYAWVFIGLSMATVKQVGKDTQGPR